MNMPTSAPQLHDVPGIASAEDGMVILDGLMGWQSP